MPPPKLDRNTGQDFVPTQRGDTYAAISPLQWNLEGRNVLITGSARGLGRAEAIAYAKAGVSGLVLIDILDAKPVEADVLAAASEAKRSPPKVLCLKVDITSEDSVAQAVKAVAAEFASLDIVVNNAGHNTYVPILDTDAATWWRCWEVNVKGPFLIARGFLPLLFKGREKTIVVLSSVGAHFTLPGGSAYETSKQAVLKLNGYLNLEHQSEGILAYAVAPGGVLTAMADQFPKHLHDRLSDTPELVADTLVFLTKERRQWLADRYVDSRWDMLELLEKKDEIVEKDLLKVRMAL